MGKHLDTVVRGICICIAFVFGTTLVGLMIAAQPDASIQIVDAFKVGLLFSIPLCAIAYLVFMPAP